MSTINKSRSTKFFVMGPFLACVSASNLGCVDLALMGIGAAIRQNQNNRLIEEQQAMEAQRAERDHRMIEAMQEHQRRLAGSTSDSTRWHDDRMARQALGAGEGT